MASLRRCWVIVDGTQPTAFHAREADDLVPTLRQLQRTQPNVRLMWFERERLWPSPEAARQELRERRERPPVGRGRDWRPGGDHRDPKARPEVPRDVRRARFKKRLIQKKSSGASRERSGQGGPTPERRWPDRPPGDRRDPGRQSERETGPRNERQPSDRRGSNRSVANGRRTGSDRFGQKTEDWRRRDKRDSQNGPSSPRKRFGQDRGEAGPKRRKPK